MLFSAFRNHAERTEGNMNNAIEAYRSMKCRLNKCWRLFNVPKLLSKEGT